MKKVLILSGSPRKGGNSDILCDEFAKGALANGHEVEKICVAERKIAPCLGCYYCKDHGGKCVLNDGMEEILQKIIAADVLVLATPVYFYSMCAQLKAVIDRNGSALDGNCQQRAVLYYDGCRGRARHDGRHACLFARVRDVHRRLRRKGNFIRQRGI